MDLRVEPSPSGGYVVRMQGHDVPVSRHDTEEEAEEWVARHAGSAAAPATAAAPAPAATPAHARRELPHFVGIDGGTQILLRHSAARDAGTPAAGAAVVAVDPISGAVVGAVGDDGHVWADPAWAARGLTGALGEMAREPRGFRVD